MSASALADADLDAVFTAAIATTPYSSAGFASSYDAAVAGYREAWSEVLDRGIPVVTVVDNPVWETDPNKCLRTRAMRECDGPRAELLVTDDPLRDAAAGSRASRCSISRTSSAARRSAHRSWEGRTSTAIRIT